jgi:hypothetical protein
MDDDAPHIAERVLATCADLGPLEIGARQRNLQEILASRGITCDQLSEVQQRALVVGHPCREVGHRLGRDCRGRDDELLTRHDHLVSRSRATHKPRTRSVSRLVDNNLLRRFRRAV